MLETVLEIVIYFSKNKKFWLVPLILLILILSWLVFFSQGAALAPFVYTLF